MNSLNANDNIPVGKLVATLNYIITICKFYWLLSISEQVKKSKTLISKKVLFAEMVSHAWFTVNYFHVSFGKHHDLGQHIQKLREIESISKKASKEEIQKQLVSSKKFE